MTDFLGPLEMKISKEAKSYAVSLLKALPLVNFKSVLPVVLRSMV